MAGIFVRSGLKSAGMKPRFSILTLLVLTTWVALNFAALRSPPATSGSIWMVAVYVGWYALLAFFAVSAAQRTSAHSVFAQGMLLFALIYSAAVWNRDGYMVTEEPAWRLPHTYIAEKLISWTISVLPPISTSEITFNFVDRAELERQQCIRRLAFCNVSLTFGLFGGCLALWRYRVLERREKHAE